jgi:hypothetical protein
MSERSYSRRAVAIGGGIAAALGLTALGVSVPRLFGHRYRSTPYDDLFAQLIDRDAAVRIGKQALSDGHTVHAKALAKDLRQRLERRSLADVTRSDLALGRLIEIKGWVLPETLALLSMLAAKES